LPEACEEELVKKKKTVKRAKATKSAKAARRTTAGKSAKAIKIPVFHHALLKTARMQEMIDWYAAVVGIEPVFQAPGIAFLSNDGANHRISLAGGPQFRDNPQFRTFAGLHHLAFEYASVDDLLDSWQRLRDQHGYEPHVAVHHGMTLSFYYVDPDGNSVELQADVFGDWKKSKKWMHTSPQFKADPIGKFVVPAKMVAARSAGIKQKELLRRAYTGEYEPSAPYDFRVDF
jgi:catechol 2,3-dioxygenase-like lactoylglutathione lyase family enzyme